MPAIPSQEIAERNRNAFEATAEIYRLMRNGVMPKQLLDAWLRLVQCAQVIPCPPALLMYLFNTYELDEWLSGDLFKLYNEASTHPEFNQEYSDVEALVKQIKDAITDCTATAST